jgi:hypothetical protein
VLVQCFSYVLYVLYGFVEYDNGLFLFFMKRRTQYSETFVSVKYIHMVSSVSTVESSQYTIDAHTVK